MNFHKLIISIILLLTYSFGFAHNLVPHCNDSGEESHNHAPNHNHHYHADEEEIDSAHSDIAHDDHFDEGINDFITVQTCDQQITLTQDNCCVLPELLTSDDTICIGGDADLTALSVSLGTLSYHASQSGADNNNDILSLNSIKILMQYK